MSDQRKPVLTGGCQCGAIRYALYGEPDRAGICHCLIRPGITTLHSA